MAITQERMIALHRAATDALEGITKLLDRIKEINSSEEQDKPVLIRGLATMATAHNFLSDPFGTTKTIELEAERIRLTLSYNIRRDRKEIRKFLRTLAPPELESISLQILDQPIIDIDETIKLITAHCEANHIKPFKLRSLLIKEETDA